MAHEALVKEGKEALKAHKKPEEVYDYFLHKGMDEKEAKKAITKLEATKAAEDAKKAEKDKILSEQKVKTIASSEKKSSLWVYFIILVVLLALGYYLYTSGIADIVKFLS